MFGPLNGAANQGEPIALTVEEYEVIRLIDLEGLEQEQCGERMNVARSTVQRMYIDAKKKVADSLVNGKILIIEGGDYEVCNLKGEQCVPCYGRGHRHGRGNGNWNGISKLERWMMITIDIPGYRTLNIKNVVFDFNGTIAEDGMIIEEVKELMFDLANKGVGIFVLTADTNGSVENECVGLPLKVEIFNQGNALSEKKKVVERLGSDGTVAFGNGRNDIEMFKSSALSIGVMGSEGLFSKSIIEADIIVNNIIDGINMLLKPNRLKATLRN